MISTSHPRGGSVDRHEAFGVASVVRRQGTPCTLFQSDLRHNETIALTISTAERNRDLHTDWTHPRETLVEIEMSLAQWGSLISSMGIGSGVPVTIRHTEKHPNTPGLPYQPRIAESVAETRGAVNRLLARARETLDALGEAITEKQGVRAIRDALRDHDTTLRNAENNAEFAVKTLTEAAEKVTAQARADIEAQIITAVHLAGVASIEPPALNFPEIETPNRKAEQ